MDSKNLTPLETIILFAGIGYLAYWFFKKPKGVINIDPKMGESIKNFDEPKTIILDLSGKKKVDNSSLFPQSMVSDYDYRQSKTFAPDRTTIKYF